MLFFKVIFFVCNAHASNDKVLACCVLERILAVFNVIREYNIEK